MPTEIQRTIPNKSFKADGTNGTLTPLAEADTKAQIVDMTWIKGNPKGLALVKQNNVGGKTFSAYQMFKPASPKSQYVPLIRIDSSWTTISISNLRSGSDPKTLN